MRTHFRSKMFGQIARIIRRRQKGSAEAAVAGTARRTLLSERGLKRRGGCRNGKAYAAQRARPQASWDMKRWGAWCISLRLSRRRSKTRPNDTFFRTARRARHLRRYNWLGELTPPSLQLAWVVALYLERAQNHHRSLLQHMPLPRAGSVATEIFAWSLAI
jgi:hypothetical protein